MRIKFKRDTSFRKQFFVPDSFAHPAKMDAQLLLWIVNRYSVAGETILDPMAGSGTSMLACTLGRNVILVELEEKFCKMMRDNWEQVKMRPQLGSTMGDCQIIQGDARQLENIPCDKIISSPPYIAQTSTSKQTEGLFKGRQLFKNGRDPQPHSEGQIGDLPYKQVDKIVTSPPYANPAIGENKTAGETRALRKTQGGGLGQSLRQPEGYSTDPNNIGNLPYGEIDKCIFSPPYAEAHNKDHPDSWGGLGKDRADLADYRYIKEDNPDNVGNLPYGQIDKIVTSPPYEASVTGKDGIDWSKGTRKNSKLGYGYIKPRDRSKEPAFNHLSIGGAGFNYGDGKDNIGNLKSQSYLEAMLQVYQQCYGVLKPQGLMILVTKNFIRNKQVVRLDEDTIKLCEQAGFSFVERHYRELPSQSFWRVIYHQKFPDVEQIKSEDVLVFKR